VSRASENSLVESTSTLPPKIPEEPESPFAPVDEEGRPYLPMSLGPASRSGARAYNPVSVEAPGIDTSGRSLLAAQLHWAASRTHHAQTAIEIFDTKVNVDVSLARFIRRLNADGFQTIAGCDGPGIRCGPLRLVKARNTRHPGDKGMVSRWRSRWPCSGDGDAQMRRSRRF